MDELVCVASLRAVRALAVRARPDVLRDGLSRFLPDTKVWLIYIPRRKSARTILEKEQPEASMLETLW